MGILFPTLEKRAIIMRMSLLVLVALGAYTAVQAGGECQVGFKFVPGDVIGNSNIPGGSLTNIKSTAECGDKCLMTNACRSYEYSPSLKKCNLMKEAEPDSEVYEDFAFCVRAEGSGTDCSRPSSNWCRHNRASYEGSTDCDGDGFVDQFCTFRGASGIKIALLSLNDCTQTQYEMPASSRATCESVKGDCSYDGHCRYKAKTNSELKTKCDKTQTGTSYSTRGPDFEALTSANPYTPKRLYKCGCQDNYVQKSDNWRQEGCVECTSSDSSKCGKNMECQANACVCLTTQSFQRIDGNDHTKGCDLSPDQLCTTKSGTVWNSGTSTCECEPNLIFKNGQNTDEGCAQCTITDSSKCGNNMLCDALNSCSCVPSSLVKLDDDDHTQGCGECKGDNTCVALNNGKGKCDVSSNTCVQCTGHSDCSTVQKPECSASKTCVECTDDTICVANSNGKGKCQTSSNTCVECGTVRDCPSQTNVECTTAGGCQCKAGFPVKLATDDTLIDGCVECKEDDTCVANGNGKDKCDDSSNTCVQCSEAVDCSTVQGKPDCSTSNTCVECTEDAACVANSNGKGKCQTSSNTCVECLNDGHCSAQPNVKCGNDGFCECKPQFAFTKSASGDLSEGCVECKVDGDCPDGVCDSNTCVQCLQKDDCNGVEGKPACDVASKTCVECLEKLDCGQVQGKPECDVASKTCVECEADEHCSDRTTDMKLKCATIGDNKNKCVKCLESLDCNDIETCTNNECSSIMDDRTQTCSECTEDRCRTTLEQPQDVRKGHCVSDEVILLVGGFERDGSPVSGAQDISETIFTYDCDRPNFPESTASTGITFNTAALTADPIQKVITCGGSEQKKCFHLTQGGFISKQMVWQERTNMLTSEFTGNAGENSVTMPNGVHIVAGSGYQSLKRTHTSNTEEEWSETQSLPEGATFKDACTIRISDKEFLVLGGTSADVEYSKKVMKYHTVDQTWTPLTDLKMGRRAHACALYDVGPKPYIVIAGGEGEDAIGQDGVLTSTEIYHFKTNPATSEMAGDLNTARWAHGMVFVMKPNPRLLTLGGFSNGDDLPPEALNTMEEWDPVGKTWDAIETTMNKQRAFFGVVVAPREAVCCPPNDEKWILGNGAESCSDVCFRRGQVCDDTKQAELHSDSNPVKIFDDALNTYSDKWGNCREKKVEKVDYATIPGPIVNMDDGKCYANKNVNCDVATRSDKLRPLCYCKTG